MANKISSSNSEHNIKKNVWNNRSVLVTGGAGFIGSWLSWALFKSGAHVVILDKKKSFPLSGEPWEALKAGVTYISGDIRESQLLLRLFRKYKPQTVFHLAAEAIVGRAYKNPAKALDTNVRGTWTVLEVCRKTSPEVVVVMASSDKAYGSHAKLPYREDFPLLGENPYDCSKSVADRVAQMYAKSFGVRLAVTRCGNVYGGGDLNFSRLVPETIRAIFLKRNPKIRSDGLYRRDYVHVSDIVGAYVRTAEALIKNEIQPGDAFNFGTNTPRTALEVIKKLIELTGSKKSPIILATARYEIRDQYLDSTKARKTLGWTPVVQFEDGLRSTINWYSKYF